MSGKHVYARPHDVVIDGESGMVLVDEFELRLVADSVTTLLPLLPPDGVREL